MQLVPDAYSCFHLVSYQITLLLAGTTLYKLLLLPKRTVHQLVLPPTLEMDALLINTGQDILVSIAGIKCLTARLADSIEIVLCKRYALHAQMDMT